MAVEVEAIVGTIHHLHFCNNIETEAEKIEAKAGKTKSMEVEAEAIDVDAEAEMANF